jgi:hypothetical protein
MPRFSQFQVVLLVAFIAGCSLTPPTPPPAPNARHLQERTSGNGGVVLQLSFPTPKNCTDVLKAVRTANGEKAKFVTCSDVSASAGLHAYAEVLDTRNGLLMHLEVLSISDCTTAVNGIMSDAVRDTNQLVVPCTRK